MVNPQKRLARGYANIIHDMGNVKLNKVNQIQVMKSEVDAEADTLLTAAIKNNQLELVEYLLNQGIDINEYNANAMTPLMLACELGCTDIVRLLLECGADTECVDILGQTALYYAFISNKVEFEEIVKLLLEFGANINSFDDNGVSPLMACIILSDSISAIHLIKLGADINALDGDGQSIMEYAQTFNQIELIKYLINNPIVSDHE